MMRSAPKKVITIYDKKTGVIDRSVSVVPGKEHERCREHEEWVDGRHAADNLFVDPVTKQVTVNDELAVFQSFNLIEGIPSHSQVIVASKKYTLNTDSLFLDVNFDMVIPVIINAPSRNPITVEVECKPDQTFPLFDHDTIKVEQVYTRLRSKNYPSIGDQLDALWKGLAAYHAGEELPVETVNMLSTINETKNKFKKG